MNNTSEDFISIINQLLAGGQYYILDSIFLEYKDLDHGKAKSLLKETFHTNLYVKNEICKANKFNNYWEQINIFFKEFEDIEQKIIVDKIKGINTWNEPVKLSVLEICQKYADQFEKIDDKIDFYSEYLEFLLNDDHPIENCSNQDIQSLWLVNQLKENNENYMEHKREYCFNFLIHTEEKLEDVLKSISKKYEYYDFKFILEHTALNTLYDLFLEEKIKFNDNELFPESFYQIKIIQRLLINIDLKEGLNKDTLEVLVKNIDYEDKLYGAEMNEFVVKYPDISPSISDIIYIDGISISEINIMEQPQKLVISSLEDKKEVNNFIEELEKKTKHQTGTFDEMERWEEVKEILNIINTEDYWRDNHHMNEYFIEKLIESESLRVSWKVLIIEMLILGISKKFINDRLFGLYIKHINTKEIQSDFDISDEKLCKCLIDFSEENSKHDVYRFIFKEITPKNLNCDSIFYNKNSSIYIEINDFINTDLGRYYGVVKSISPSIQDKFKNDIINGIRECKGNYSYYLAGMFYQYFDIDKIEKSEDKVHTFIGFSHRYIVGSNTIDQFVEAAKKLFSINIADKYIVENLAIILIKRVDPYKEGFRINIEEPNLRKLVFQEILDIYFEIPNALDTEINKWIKWFVQNNDYMNILVKKILVNISKENSQKLKQLIGFMDVFGQVGKAEMNDYYLWRMYRLNNFSKNDFDILSDLIKVLLQKKYIVVNELFVSVCISIIKRMDEIDYREGIATLQNNVNPYLLESDIKKLKSNIL